MEIKRFGNIEGKTMMLLHGNLGFDPAAGKEILRVCRQLRWL